MHMLGWCLAGRQGVVTCEHLLGHLEGVDDRRGDSCHGPDHAAQAQVDEHEEEHDGPERGGREMCHGLSEGDEGQACALHRLRVGQRVGATLTPRVPCLLPAAVRAIGIAIPYFIGISITT